MGWSHVETETSVLEGELRNLSRDAHIRAKEHLGATTQLEVTPALTDEHNAFHEYAINEMVSQIGRDISQIVRDYRKSSIRSEMLRETRGISREAARVEIQIRETNHRRKLWMTDRSGRKIPSQTFIRRLWRMTLRDGALWSYMKTLADHGVSQATIWHPDPSHGSYGMMINLEDVDFGLSDFDREFHPNSNAFPVFDLNMVA